MKKDKYYIDHLQSAMDTELTNLFDTIADNTSNKADNLRNPESEQHPILPFNFHWNNFVIKQTIRKSSMGYCWEEIHYFPYIFLTDFTTIYYKFHKILKLDMTCGGIAVIVSYNDKYLQMIIESLKTFSDCANNYLTDKIYYTHELFKLDQQNKLIKEKEYVDNNLYQKDIIEANVTLYKIR